MRGGTSETESPAPLDRSDDLSSAASPSVIFPLPGGRNVAASAWVAVSPEEPPDLDTRPGEGAGGKARRWFVRRLPLADEPGETAAFVASERSPEPAQPL